MYKVLEVAHDETEVGSLGLESWPINNSEIPSDDEQDRNPQLNSVSRTEMEQG